MATPNYGYEKRQKELLKKKKKEEKLRNKADRKIAPDTEEGGDVLQEPLVDLSVVIGDQKSAA